MLGDDWPPFYPLELERKIEIVVEESVHYYVGASARDEWRLKPRVRVRVRRRGAARRREPDVCGVALPPNALPAQPARAALITPPHPSPTIMTMTDEEDDRDTRTFNTA